MAKDRIIFLTGFSSSGKSTVGPLIARTLKFDFIDIDSELERKEGKAIADIFAMDGKRAFRKMEQSFIEDMIVNHKRNSVVSLGGGALINKNLRATVKQNGLLIYLSCSVRELYRRLRNTDDRPLLANRQSSTSREKQLIKIKKLLTQRLPGYKEAHKTLSTTGRSEKIVVSELIRIISKSGFLK